MYFLEVGNLLIAVAVIAALVFGFVAGTLINALRNALLVWVLFLAAWYYWGPPLPYNDLWSHAFAAVAMGVVLLGVGAVGQWLKGLFGRTAT